MLPKMLSSGRFSVTGWSAFVTSTRRGAFTVARASVGVAAALSATFTDDGAFLPPHAPRVDGPDNIQEFWAIVLGQPGFSIMWEPTSAHVSEGGDLGYTLGPYEMTVDDPDGNPMSLVGKYLTVWRKQADGQWKVTADIFNEDAPPPTTAEP